MLKSKFVCELCKNEYEIDKYKLAKKKTPYCNKCCSIATQKGIKRPDKSRENSGRWKGGSYTSSDGYVMVKAENEYHPSGRQKYKKEHIVVYETFIGRELLTGKGGDGEQLHHVNGIKTDNSLDNLVYCEGIKEHRLLHCQLETIAFKLVQLGLIKFNKELNEYYIDKNFKFNES